MAIRRPGIYTSEFFFQDFLDDSEEGVEYRQIDVKYADGIPYERVSETFDYSNPPYADPLQRGGNIVASLYYRHILTNPGIIILDDWYINWRDEWPLRLASNYLVNCLYPPGRQISFYVGKEAYAFWASEQFAPVDNLPSTYMGYPPTYLENITFG